MPCADTNESVPTLHTNLKSVFTDRKDRRIRLSCGLKNRLFSVLTDFVSVVVFCTRNLQKSSISPDFTGIPVCSEESNTLLAVNEVFQPASQCDSAFEEDF